MRYASGARLLCSCGFGVGLLHLHSSADGFMNDPFAYAMVRTRVGALAFFVPVVSAEGGLLCHVDVDCHWSNRRLGGA